MPFEKVFELVCDNPNCCEAMNHLLDCSLKQAKKIAKNYGHIVVGNKCYCDQKCYDTRNDK